MHPYPKTRCVLAAIPLGHALPHGSSNQPGRSMRNTPADPCGPARRPYSVLLRVGFAVRLLLPATRCALTAPFHPYLVNEAVCSLWHFPWTSQQATRPAGVTRHPCFVEPGLSSRFKRTPRLPGPLAGRDVGDGGIGGKKGALADATHDQLRRQRGCLRGSVRRSSAPAEIAARSRSLTGLGTRDSGNWRTASPSATSMQSILAIGLFDVK